MPATDVIESYLAELERLLRPLPRIARRRILAEAREHLVDGAASDGPGAAIGRFGSPSEIAAAHVASAAPAATTRSVVGFAAAGIGYGLVQAASAPAGFGLFPPGPWPNDVPPAYLAWKVDLAGTLIAVSIVLGVAAVVSAWRARPGGDRVRRRTTTLALCGALLFAASWPFETLFEFQRANNVAGSPGSFVVGLISAAQLACHAVALWVTFRGDRLVRALASTEPLGPAATAR